MNDYSIVIDWLDENGIYLSERYCDHAVLTLLQRLCEFYDDDG